MPDENTVQAIVQYDYYLYIGTDNGIHKLNLLTWNFEDTDQDFYKVSAVRALAVFDGKLWIGTRDDGLLYFDIQKGKLHKIAPKNFVAKNATVKPSKVAGTALSNTAGLPICFI